MVRVCDRGPGSGLVYFAGDTGFGPHFARIREDSDRLHVALLPIGAYAPRWFMSPVHMSPDEAMRAHEILAARTSIAIHHGTFQLADEGIDTPAKVLRESARNESLRVLRNGEFADSGVRSTGADTSGAIAGDCR